MAADVVQLPGGRWLLTPVVMVLALGSIGATYENITTGDLDAYANSGP